MTLSQSFSGIELDYRIHRHEERLNAPTRNTKRCLTVRARQTYSLRSCLSRARVVKLKEGRRSKHYAVLDPNVSYLTHP